MKFFGVVLMGIMLVSNISCGPDRGKLIIEETGKVDMVAQKINADFKKIKKGVKELATRIELLYETQADYHSKNAEKLNISSEGVMYKPEDDGGSAVFVSGFVPVNKQIENIVRFTSPLDEVFKMIVKNFPDVVQVYYNDEFSYNRIYPFFDVLTQYPPGMNIPAYNFYYLADLAHNPEKDAVWVDEPYVDPAGRGWMISAIAPVYYKDRLVGVPGLDVTVNTILDRYIEDRPNIFIVDKTGMLVAVKDKMVRLLSMPPLLDHQYYETIKSDLYRKDDYNLLKCKNRVIREIAESLLIRGESGLEFEHENQEYAAVATFMDELKWTVVSIIQI